MINDLNPNEEFEYWVVQVPIRKGVIDPYTRVTDNGRETIHGQVGILILIGGDMYRVLHVEAVL